MVCKLEVTQLRLNPKSVLLLFNRRCWKWVVAKQASLCWFVLNEKLVWSTLISLITLYKEVNLLIYVHFHVLQRDWFFFKNFTLNHGLHLIANLVSYNFAPKDTRNEIELYQWRLCFWGECGPVLDDAVFLTVRGNHERLSRMKF